MSFWSRRSKLILSKWTRDFEIEKKKSTQKNSFNFWVSDIDSIIIEYCKFYDVWDTRQGFCALDIHINGTISMYPYISKLKKLLNIQLIYI